MASQQAYYKSAGGLALEVTWQQWFLNFEGVPSSKNAATAGHLGNDPVVPPK